MPWFDRATSRLPRNSVLGSCTDGLEQQLALLVSPLQGRASPAALRGQSTVGAADKLEMKVHVKSSVCTRHDRAEQTADTVTKPVVCIAVC